MSAVRIADGWGVYVDAEQRTGGEVVEVDAATAEHWIGRGWAEPVEQPPARSQSRSAARR